jgi:hypothetical protein
LAEKEFGIGADRLVAAPGGSTLLKEFESLLALQAAMQRENLIFTTASNALKARHEAAKRSISKLR